MSATQQAKRYRKNAVGGFKNIPKQKRPHYKSMDSTVASLRLQKKIQAERERQMRSKRRA